MNHKGMAFLCPVCLPLPSPDDKTADADRLCNELEKKGISNTVIPLNILRRLPQEIRQNEFSLQLVIGLDKAGPKILDIGRQNVYGLAFDIGTTNIACSLADLERGKKIDLIEAENPQMQFGSDVLTRVQKAITGESALMAEELMHGINRMITAICEKNSIAPDDVFAVTVAGNTIMSHFFLGLDVRNIPLSPYIPAVNRSGVYPAAEVGMKINQNAIVYVFPNSGSYVGGDIISGIVFSDIYHEKKPVLFIDVGTNAEITLGCSEWIMTGAGAAGPALEEGIAGIGKKAEAGAISRVTINPENRKMDIEVISGVEPSGICGSGIIDLVSELYNANIIDQSGKFTDSAEGVIEKEGGKAFLVYRSGTKELYLTEREIENFLLSKAAMFTFIYVFVKSVGLTFKDIEKVYIAGALGCGINLDKAVNIGLLPDMPREKFIPLGNASLGGAEKVLMNSGLQTEIETMLARITYREMNEDNELMNALQGALFIPHTEPDLLKG